jgi:hypothetical protein
MISTLRPTDSAICDIWLRRAGRRLVVVAVLVASTCVGSSIASGQYLGYRGYGYLPYRNRGYGYGYGMAGTAASAAQFGMARMIASAGYANMMNSRAAQNYAAARATDLQNRAQWTNSYYQMRQAHRAYEGDHSRLTMDEITKIAQDSAPKRLDITQLDSATGKIAWPTILQDARYASDCDQLETLYRLRATSTGPIDAETFRDIRNICEQLKAELKSNIKEYSVNDFEQGKHFLDSLGYEAHFPRG